MKCIVCNAINSYKANYCAECGHKFTDEEKKEAYGKTMGSKTGISPQLDNPF